VVAAVGLDGEGRVASARASYVTAGELGAVVDLTDAVSGEPARAADWAAAGRAAAERVATEADIHASAAYRRQLVRVLTARALEQAATCTGGEPVREAA
jgi:carbon-monoxide dehydrogenase medium subunit